MAKISILIAFLTHFLCALGQSQLSQCSEYFTHVIKLGTTDMLGQIKISPPVANDIFYLKVALSTTTELSQVVRLELARSIKESVRHVHQGRPLLYHVYYPMNEQIPSLSAIWFNGQQYCPDPEVSENITANVELGHILFAPNEAPLVYGPWQEISQPYHRNLTNYRIDNPSYDRLNHYSGLNECGITSYYTDDTNRLISDGEEWLPGQWPWLVAIYFQDNKEYIFLCADKRCIMNGTTSSALLLESQRLWVLFGQFNSRNWNGNHPGIINRVVLYYRFIPSDYDIPYEGLAILILKKTVEYNAFIRPICLWSGTNLQDMVNMTGYLIGWGYDFVGVKSIDDWKTYTEVPRMVKVPLLNVREGLKNRFFYLHPKHRSLIFCADTGSGLMVFDTTMGRYQLRGVTDSCWWNATVFLDVANWTSYIRQQILLT